MKRRKQKPNDFPFMNHELQRSIYLRNKYCTKYHKYRTPTYNVLYKTQRNKVTQIKRKLIRSYFTEKCSGGTKNKDFWKTMKPFLMKSSSNRSDITLRENDEIITDPSQLCDIFNDFFVGIGSDIGTPENNKQPLQSIIDVYKEHSSTYT